MFVTMMLTLLIKPTSGVLEDIYCSQFPITDNKLNYLYILHHHLNHPANQHMIPLVIKSVTDLKPFPSGQRLLKLLCNGLNDFSVYKQLGILGQGTYGVIYDCGLKFD